MKEKIKIVLAIVGVLTTVSALVLTKCEGGNSLPVVKQDSVSSVIEKKSVTENTFEIIDLGKLKTHLLDSLKRTLKPELITVYEKVNYNLDSLISEAKKEALAQFKDSLNKPVFSSKVDANYALKDASGRVRDSVNATSTIHSPIPLSRYNQHSISMRHKSFDYDSVKTIVKNSIWDNVKPGVVTAFGYGVKSKMWDWFIGAGARFDIEGIIKNIME